MKRQYALVQQGLQLSGDTFPLRQHLKDLGARWVPASKTWIMPHTPENVEALLGWGFALKLDQVEDLEHARKLVQNSEQRNWSVSELANRISQALAEKLPPQFWLVGETIQVQKSRGHHWLEIADQIDAAEVYQMEFTNRSSVAAVTQRASISAVIWSGVAERLKKNLALKNEKASSRLDELPLEVGLKIRLLVHLDFREEGGKVQLIVDDLDVSYTQGQMALGREQILAELRKRGLISLNKQKRLARFPLRIALITANSSRARNDFLHEITRSGFSFETKLFDARMQGEGTADDIVKALSLIAHEHAASPDRPPYAAIVITRGGGSRMDLRWFDDFEIAKGVAYAPVPVITAIGHFEDESIADAVSFVAEKTPTAAAQFLAQTATASLFELHQRMTQSMGRAKERVLNGQSRIDNTLSNIKRAAFVRLATARKLIESHERLVKVFLKHMSASLSRGYAILRSAESRVLRAEDFLVGEFPRDLRIELRSREGTQKVTLYATVEKFQTDSLAEFSMAEEKNGLTSQQTSARGAKQREKQ